MNEKFMKRALKLASKAASIGEVPVGAVIVRDDKVIATGYNKRETGKNALYHAEIRAINRACKKLGGWRLTGCSLYVTLEPCAMCGGAIINSRIETVYIGTKDPKAGAMGSVCNLTEMGFNHKPAVFYDILKDDCSNILKDFFKTLRERKD